MCNLVASAAAWGGAVSRGTKYLNFGPGGSSGIRWNLGTLNVGVGRGVGGCVGEGGVGDGSPVIPGEAIMTTPNSPAPTPPEPLCPEESPLPAGPAFWSWR